MTRIIKIGSYRLGETLGEGSFGKVKLAEHEQTGNKVAVKILNREKIKSSKMETKIKREITILKLLKHPHVIRLYEVIDTPKEIYLVIEYVSGGELFNYIVKHGKLEEAEARKLFQQIVFGMDYCHQHRVVHRDLKPENLLLSQDGSVKIADFGLSNMMMDGSFLKTSCGSPNYAAPEVITGKLYAGPEVDVWSCGVILYALLCGKLPFDEDSIPNLFRKIRECRYHIPSYVPKGAADLIKKILVVDPLNRCTIAQIKEDPWFNVDVPKYLNISSAISHRGHEIDEDILDEAIAKVAEVPKDRNQIKNDIKSGNPTSITVAYQLMYDNHMKRMMRERQLNGDEASWPTNNFSPQEFTFEEVEQNTPYESSINNTSSSPYAFSPPIIHKLQVDTQLRDPDQRPFNLGLTTKLHPNKAMQVIYKTLKKMNFHWKIESSFNLQCRSTSREAPYGNILIGLQLYVDDIEKRHYVLDIQQLHGSTFVFIDIVNQFVNLIKGPFSLKE